MKILLTGKNGQMNWEINRTIATVGTFFAPTEKRDNPPKSETLGSVLQDIQPDIIINAAAYTAVDRESRNPNSAPN